MGTTLIFLISSAISIGFGVVFWVAVQALLNGIGSFAATQIIIEIFDVVSMCLPFSLTQLLGSFVVVAYSVLTFLAARKIFNLVSELLGNAKA